MNTQQLESFLAVAENLNFARAAESLNITQSAVSRQIHALENELDATLFRRTSRSVTLTPAGASFYADAQNFMRDLNAATERIKRHSASNAQPLAIGFASDMNCVLFADLLKVCHERFPELYPILRIIPHRAIFSLFFQGDIDVMFDFKDNAPARTGISYIEFVRTPVCCVVPSGHRFSGKKEIREHELYDERLILCNSYSLPPQATDLQNRLKRHFLPETICYCDNPNVLLTLVKAGYGFGILPRLNIQDPEMCAIPFAEEPSVSFGLFYNEERTDPTVDQFLSILHDLKKEPHVIC
ncbi:MAG: LysR family transcriptional regulator [Roseburia sp.]|nr:LysR family transcriptional regulator [Roseburia sp.]